MDNLQGLTLTSGLHFNDHLYKGSISKFKLNESIKIYEIDLKSYTDNTFYFDKEDCLNVVINIESKNPLSINVDSQVCDVKPFASVVLCLQSQLAVSVVFKKNVDYNFTVLEIDRTKLEIRQPNVLHFLNGIFEANFQEKYALCNDGQPNLTICDFVKKLRNIDKNEFENQLIAAGYCNIIIGLKFKEIYRKKQTSHVSFLRIHEIKKLEELTETIRNNPEHPYTIEEICRQTGLSVSKLQLGFKEMHNRTVALFIRDMRLEKALEMFKNTDLNISEIVYSVGLNSRSYFCRIFKKKYKCAPKYYQKQLRHTFKSVS
ncbi:AraC-like DNA-binding protein [Mariniflexile fucanivorans]|uniref:AraC-like DNA-binding protein n=1 Tax=Mariniflexile fucanivorans TaxID=264023 RepID=A0A4R1RNQ0_9FLAO|nr:AraC family transcriptional regulator [Mariniflexile fucanivorans]TCL67866.1 AraC-like DNA-binding protein [Mariniflexile fucanivorans]